MNLKKIGLGLSRALIVVLLPVTLLLTVLQFYAFDKDFYLNEYQKYNVPATTTMGMEDLERVTVKMIGYLKDEEENLDIQAVIKGETREVFGEREKQHMVDVKHLFLGGYAIRNYGLLILLAAFALIYGISQRKQRDIYKNLLYSSVFSLAMMLLLFILVQIDFYKYFTKFHEIFFTNDLWLLDPNTEVLIQMLPLEFFIDITTRVLGWFAGVMGAIGVLSYWKLRENKLNR